jgi:hypothetical protein
VILQKLAKNQTDEIKSDLIIAQAPWFNKKDALSFMEEGGWTWLFKTKNTSVFSHLSDLLRDTNE